MNDRIWHHLLGSLIILASLLVTTRLSGTTALIFEPTFIYLIAVAIAARWQGRLSGWAIAAIGAIYYWLALGSYSVGAWLLLALGGAAIAWLASPPQDPSSFSQLVQELNIIFWLRDPQTGQFTYLSPAAGTILGYSAEHWQQNPKLWTQHIHPEDRDRVLSDLQQQLASPQRQRALEFRFIAASGQVIWLRDKMAAIKDPWGKIKIWGGCMMDITAQKQCEQEEQKLSSILDNSFDFIGMVTLDGEILYINKAGQKTIGLNSPDEVCQTRILDYFCPEDRARVQEQILPGMVEQGRWESEIRFRHFQGGEPIWVQWNAFAIKDSHTGQAIAFATTARNITEQKLAQSQLQESEERLHLAVEAAQLGTWCYEISTGKGFWSERCQKILLGKTLNSDAYDYQLFDSCLHPEDRAQAWAEFQRAVAAKEDYNIECRALWSDGTVHWFASVGRTYYSPDNAPLRTMGIVMDISERKLAETALQQSEKRFRRLVEANIIGIAFGNFQGEITDANDAFLELLGYSRDQLLAGNLRWPGITPPEYLPVDRSAMKQLLKTGAIAPFEQEYLRQDGSRVPVLIGAAVLEGYEDMGVAFVLDLTERKRMEEDLRQRTEQLIQADRLKDEFLAAVSHELRSPLNAILGWAQMLRSRHLNEEMTRKALEIIERNAKIQAQLIEDLLDVSRIIAGKLRLNCHTVKLAPIIEAAVDTVQLAAEAKGISLQVIIEPLTEQVLGDPDRLQQVVWNLLFNAIKFTPKGGKVQLQLQQASAPSGVELSVSDTGIGIAPEFLPHVFEPFRQADATIARRQGGLGLGLAIARRVVELHGGTLEVSSPGEGLGSTFTIRLPATNATLADSSGDAVNQPPASSKEVQQAVN